jgi:hypothetical protein
MTVGRVEIRLAGYQLCRELKVPSACSEQRRQRIRLIGQSGITSRRDFAMHLSVEKLSKALPIGSDKQSGCSFRQPAAAAMIPDIGS